MRYVWVCTAGHVAAVTETNAKPKIKCPGPCGKVLNAGKKYPLEIADEAAVHYQVGQLVPVMEMPPLPPITLGSSEWLDKGYSVLSFMAVNGKASVSLCRYYSSIFGADHTTLLLICHGRQDLTSLVVPGTDLMGKYAYMSGKGESVVRQYHYKLLPRLAVATQNLSWQPSNVPNAYVGPHGGGDGIETERVPFNAATRAVLKVCDVAVMTHLSLAPDCDADYRNDGKIPLGDVVRPLMKCGYERFLLMCCRSPWQTGKVSMDSGKPQERSRLLYSYDDTQIEFVPRPRSKSWP